ncbi:TPR domain protein [Hypoxylon fragiforme]|uniref:TPR domain protein n=1 Tax=Hypoxylon fragiforme TaxID=63214 RepID=UPI0020C72BB0|nr:TPR domain protein [Hypoxylon fragiforme]KAI2603156.1 TPR domain protein [Hypoxylon fragiforme]
MDEASPYFNLGTYSRPVSSPSAAARTWVNRGLIWSYGFNHEESVKCFERAIACDAECVLAYWGLAYVLGPNYNKPWDFFDPVELEAVMRRTHGVVDQALVLAKGGEDDDDDGKKEGSKVTPVERALVEALKFRYPHGHSAGEGEGDEKEKEKEGKGNRDRNFPIWNARYADAMGAVYRRFPTDLDVATLYVDAMMNLTPWQLWDIHTGSPAPGARTLECKAVLERSMAQNNENGDGSRHPGLLHLYIHLMEMSTTPEAALPAANTLRDLVPDAGHLDHMPTHIDVLVGDYQRAMSSNQTAIIADDLFFSHPSLSSEPPGFYTLYRMHDLHFRLYAAMFAGQSAVALETVARLEQAVPESLLRVESPPMADWLEGFLAMRVHALIRFGRWRALLSLPLPPDAALYCTTHALTHYARGVAFAATGDVASAAQSRSRFLDAVDRVPASRMLFNNTCRDILAVAAAMLDGELEYRRGNHEAAYRLLREAGRRSRGLPYDEPWGWMQPPSHALGALLAEQGHYDRAVGVYAEDLGMGEEGALLPRALQHRGNVWALHGYHECLVKLGREEEAEAVRPQLDAALAVADVPIKASCFCRTSAY